MRRALLIAVATALLAVSGASAGAWGDVYDYGDTGQVGTPRAAALTALKRELIERGYSKGLDATLPYYGDAMRNRVTEFQTAQGLRVTGRVGPDTSRRLFRARVYVAENAWTVPNHDACRLINLESAFDPAATGYVDPRDRGFGQINAFFHPDVTDAEAFDPAFSIPWVARYLQSAFVYFQTRAERPWRAAIAAFNGGLGGAQAWVDAGYPSDSTLGQYVALVLSRPC